MSAATTGVTESLFGRYFLYLTEKEKKKKSPDSSFRQTSSKQPLEFPRCWSGPCRGGPTGQCVEVNAGLKANLTVGCRPDTVLWGGGGASTPLLPRCGKRGSCGAWFGRCRIGQPFSLTRRGWKEIVKEGDEPQRRSDILNYSRSSPFATEANIFAKTQSSHAGTRVPRRDRELPEARGGLSETRKRGGELPLSLATCPSRRAAAIRASTQAV